MRQQDYMEDTVSYVYFSSSVLIATKMNNRQVTAQFSHADRSFIRKTLPRYGSRLTPKESSSSFFFILLGFPLSYFQSPPFGNAVCKVGLVPITNQRGYKWAYTQVYLTIVNYITVGWVVYVIPYVFP